MLSISTKSKYGLKAVLALAESFDQGLLSIKEIAAQQNIPRQYLEQIFNRLGKANIVRSVRGKQGGYRLARPPAYITVAEIVTLLEGGLDFTIGPSGPEDAITALFRRAEEKLLQVLDVSLADLLSQQQRLRNVPMYTI
jgi:Rrf2 family cysteine metabolism transcriptional repressor